MADAGSRRHHLEIVERVAAPLEELVALAVALIFELDVLFERLGIAELVDHDAVVDDQVDRHQRIDLLRVAAELRHRVAHRGEVDHRRNAGEVLHQHPRRAILDLAGDPPLLLPVDHRLEVVAGDRLRRPRSAAGSRAAPSSRRAGARCRRAPRPPWPASNRRSSCPRPRGSSGCGGCPGRSGSSLSFAVRGMVAAKWERERP